MNREYTTPLEKESCLLQLRSRAAWLSHFVLVLAIAAFATSAAQAQLPSWVTISDEDFAKQYGEQATSDDLAEQSAIAWMLFARVNQPGKGQAVTWEMWPSNDDTFSPAVPRFTMANKVRLRPHLQDSKVHDLVSPNRANIPTKVGEEVTRNLVSYDYIMDNKLNAATTLWKRLSTGPALEFPIGAIEIKADWHEGPLPGAYSNRTPDGAVLSLVGLHIMIKVAPTPSDPFHSEDPSWFWTTFEYKKNPGLDNALSFITYRDALAPKESTALLTQAKLGAPFTNYVCNGTQIRYSDPENKDIILGNTTMENFSFTPKNAKTPKQWKTWKVSCHSCHGSASANNSHPPGPKPATGVPGNMNVNTYFFLNDVIGPLPADIAKGGYKSFDFVWALWNAK